MKQKTLYKVFIWGFLFLYVLVATISFFHAVQFFNVGNNTAMSVTLALAFEIGLALSLAAVLLSDENKRATMPWILMIILTAVQVIGNVFSTFKYMSLSDTQYYQYLAKPILFWMEGVTEESVQVVVSWIIGAILPIIALFMTDMVATNIKNLDKIKREEEERLEKSEDTAKKEERLIPETLDVMPINDKRNDKKPVETVHDQKQEEPIITEQESVTEEKTDVSEDFTETAVSDEEILAGKKKGKFRNFLKKVKNALVEN